VGVGHLSVVVLDLCGEVVHRRTVDAPPPDPVATAEAVADLLVEAMRRLPAGQAVQGVCLTVPGLVDAAGTVRRSPVLGWQAVPLQALVARQLVDRLGWTGPLCAENDANAFAAAELFGRAQAPGAEALFVYLDAGVGGGIASAGRLLRGQRGQAGEIGHIHLGEQGFEPETAVQGSFESYVSRQAVIARWGQHGGIGVASGDALGVAPGAAARGAPAATLDDFLVALRAQQPAALRTLADWAWWLGRGLASLISVLDPGRIVLGGPVAALFEPARHEVLASVARHLVPPVTLPQIGVSALGLDACAVGGAMRLHREHLSIDERLVYGAAGPTGA
jgi:predicted NBD/HSP70 family sugar kinase